MCGVPKSSTPPASDSPAQIGRRVLRRSGAGSPPHRFDAPKPVPVCVRGEPECPSPQRLVRQDGYEFLLSLGEEVGEDTESQSRAYRGELSEHAGRRDAQAALQRQIVQVMQLRTRKQLIDVTDEGLSSWTEGRVGMQCVGRRRAPFAAGLRKNGRRDADLACAIGGCLCSSSQT